MKIALVWMLCHMTAFVICIVVQCIPIHALWDLKVEKKCLNITALTRAGELASILEDVFIMLIPISELKNLHTSLRRKFALAFMFAIGSLYVYPTTSTRLALLTYEAPV